MENEVTKVKCSFTDTLNIQYPGLRGGQYDWEAECFTWYGIQVFI